MKEVEDQFKRWSSEKFAVQAEAELTLVSPLGLAVADPVDKEVVAVRQLPPDKLALESDVVSEVASGDFGA